MKLIILDRDGVVNFDSDNYIMSPAEWRPIPGSIEAIARLNQGGYRIAVATNQSGIGRGYFTEADFAALMGWMREEFARRGVDIAAVYHCPDHPTEGLGAYRRDNPWRKPGAGMFLQAEADLSLDMGRSWAIGDKRSDMAAGRAAGVGTLVLLDGSAPAAHRDGDAWIAPDFAAVTELLHSTPPG